MPLFVDENQKECSQEYYLAYKKDKSKFLIGETLVKDGDKSFTVWTRYKGVKGHAFQSTVIINKKKKLFRDFTKEEQAEYEDLSEENRYAYDNDLSDDPNLYGAYKDFYPSRALAEAGHLIIINKIVAEEVL